MRADLLSDPTGLHRVLDDQLVLPQAAQRLDVRRELWPDEVRVRVERLNLDAASFRQLERKHAGDGAAIRAEVAEIVAARGKMQNPETGSGGMLVGTVEAVGEESPSAWRSATGSPPWSRSPSPRWSSRTGSRAGTARSEQVPCDGYAVLFGRSIAAVLPDDLAPELSLAVMDVCGAPALTARVVRQYDRPTVAVIGGAGKSGSLSLAAARDAGAGRVVGVVPHQAGGRPPDGCRARRRGGGRRRARPDRAA